MIELTDNIKVFNEDCMITMSRYPDKYFDLAIVDPPYGIGDKKLTTGGTWASKYKRGDCNWDVAPNQEYFDELIRISKNQIIWGGNYFSHHIKGSRCFIVWRKVQMLGMHTMADCELALTSFDKNAKIYDGVNSTDRIHPTQKPVALYKWLLHKYAEPGQKIIDTHLGSGSSAIAAHHFGVGEFIGSELDEDYFNAFLKRFKKECSSEDMFAAYKEPQKKIKSESINFI